MDIFIIQHNFTSRFLVVKDGDVYVYKYEKCKFDRPFLRFQPKHIFIRKSKVCEMTMFSGVGDNFDFDANTIFLECNDNEYVYHSGHRIIKFKTDEKIIDCISLMGNNMIPYAFAIEVRHTCFISNQYNFLKMIKSKKEVY